MKWSTEGYKNDSPDRYNSYNIIPSGRITMKSVNFPIFGVDNLGNKQVMIPGKEYQFPGDYVIEYPMNNLNNNIMRQGGNTSREALGALANQFSYNPFQYMQDGGDVDNTGRSSSYGQEDLMRSILQALRKGKKPEEIITALVNGGHAQDETEAARLVKSVINAGQMYKGTEQEQPQFGYGGIYQDGGQSQEQPQQVGQDQQGGNDQMQQVIQKIAQELQQGVDPQKILQELVESGVPQQQAQQIIQQVIQAIQQQGGGQGQQEQGESQQQEVAEPQAQQQQEASQGQMRCGGKMPKRNYGGSFMRRS